MVVAKDEFESFSGGPYNAHAAAEIVPSDDNELAFITLAIWIGTAGNLKVTMMNGSTATFQNVHGYFIGRVRKVWATGTTATGIVAVW
ncbi:spike base protein, RCAP_Rcc01079 family [Labrys sp. 22185]|uniref:spike base protein, RCAP_Rcc01079 family n=1 Tax=Labrys sp. 22185 TaxID=3453888 RepID=UPI003F82FD10